MIYRAIWIVLGALFVAPLVLGVMLAVALGEELVPPTPEEAEDIKRWIPAMCRRTNDCCRKVREGALIALPENKVRVRSTGQVLPHTGWSQDRNSWRWNCDWNPTTQHWDVHPGAHTRCVFDHPASY